MASSTLPASASRPVTSRSCMGIELSRWREANLLPVVGQALLPAISCARQGRQECLPHSRSALRAPGGPGQAFEKLLAGHVIVRWEFFEVRLELRREFLNGLLDIAIDGVAGGPVLKDPLDPTAERFVRGNAERRRPAHGAGQRVELRGGQRLGRL